MNIKNIVEINQWIDFHKSHLTWITKREKSFGKFSIESICNVIDLKSQSCESYYLSAHVMAGNVYADDNLIKYPPYLFQIATNRDRFQIFRDYLHWNPNSDTFGTVGNLFEDLSVHLEVHQGVVHDSIKDIILCVKANELLNAKVIFIIGNCQYVCEFPVKHINIDESHKKFQIETGPILVPRMFPFFDLGKKSESSAPFFLTAYIFFNQMDRIELLLKEDPNSKSSGPRSYSKVIKISSINSIVTQKNDS